MTLTAQFTKRLGKFQLQVDITAQPGAPLALLGASGSGKSVTLKCIAGVLRPDSGRIVLNDNVLFDSERGIDLPPQKRSVGCLFQQYALFPTMTVRQNIAAGAHAQKGAAREKRVEELLARFRLEGLAGRRPGQLSGGEQQRTALARMLAAEPQAVLLDEPLSALDGFLRWKLEEELRETISRFSGPAVWVSHDRGEVYRSCRRVCLLESGRSAPVRDMEDLMRDPRTVGAARLTGCRTVVPVCPGPGIGLVEVPLWGLTLRPSTPWREGVTALGIRSERVQPAGEREENAFLCEVVGVTEDVSTMMVSLRPARAAAGAPVLWMELDKARWAALREKLRLTVAIGPENLLLLEQGGNSDVFYSGGSDGK